MFEGPCLRSDVALLCDLSKDMFFTCVSNYLLLPLSIGNCNAWYARGSESVL